MGSQYKQSTTQPSNGFERAYFSLKRAYNEMSELPFLNECSTMLREGCFVYWGQYLFFFYIISLGGRAWRRETSGRGEEWKRGGGAHDTNLTKKQTQSAQCAQAAAILYIYI